MKEESLDFFDSILNILTRNYTKSCTLEELTKIVSNLSGDLYPLTQNIATERESQAKVLDALILLDNQGFVVLNSGTDESSITTKGLIKMKIKVLCN